MRIKEKTPLDRKKDLLLWGILVSALLIVPSIPVSIITYLREYNAQIGLNGYYDSNITVLNQLGLILPFGFVGLIGLSGICFHFALYILKYTNLFKKKEGNKDENI